MERVPEDVVSFLGADRVDATGAIRLAAFLPTNDGNEPAPENIPKGDKHPPPQGQWGHKKYVAGKEPVYLIPVLHFGFQGSSR